MTPEELEFLKGIKEDISSVDVKVDKLDERQRDGCERLTRLEERVKNHLVQSEKNGMTNRERIKWALGIVGGLIVVKLSEFL